MGDLKTGSNYFAVFLAMSQLFTELPISWKKVKSGALSRRSVGVCMQSCCPVSPEARTKSPALGSSVAPTSAGMQGEKLLSGLAGGTDQRIFYQDTRQILVVATERRPLSHEWGAQLDVWEKNPKWSG